MGVYLSASYYPDGVNWRLNQKHMFCYEVNAFACCLPGMMLYWRPITQLVQAKARAVGLVGDPSRTHIPALSRLKLLIFRGGSSLALIETQTRTASSPTHQHHPHANARTHAHRHLLRATTIAQLHDRNRVSNHFLNSGLQLFPSLPQEPKRTDV